MKKTIKYVIGCIILAIFIGLGTLSYLWSTEESTTHILIDALNDPIPGKIIQPQTTEELFYWLGTTEITEVPRYYVENFPSDFPENGTPILFAQTLTPLILRANEQTLNERLILKMLARKEQLGESWTLKEKAFFNTMVYKYDCALFKTTQTRMDNLLDKVDQIPVSLAVIQSGLQTDFGRKNLQSPFGEKMWFDTKTYADRTFNTLPEAVDAYMLSLNASPSYYKWRIARKTVRPLEYSSRGTAFASLLSAYNPDDKNYTQKISAFYQETKLIRLDKAKFKD